MKHKDYMAVTMFIFLVIGLAHLWRAINQIPVNLDSFAVPIAVSWIAGTLALYLSYSAYKLRS